MNIFESLYHILVVLISGFPVLSFPVIFEHIFVQAAGLQFRGHRIFLAVVEELMSKGMRSANRVLIITLSC